jgi:hypothetical protein
MRSDSNPEAINRSTNLLVGVVELLERALAELPLTQRELDDVRTALRRAKAEVALWKAYEAAGAADPRLARRFAVKAVSGRFGIAWRAATVAFAPRLALKMRRVLRSAP